MPAPTASSTAPCSGQEALQQAVLASFPTLLALAKRMLGDHHAAEDAVQDAVSRALKSVDRFRGDASMGTWLYRITTNVCLDELRSRRRVVFADTADDGHRHVRSEGDFADSVVARTDLRAALGSLPPRQRAALVLTEVCSLSYAEAGQALGVPPGTVASRVHRAKETMRTALTDQWSSRLSSNHTRPQGANRSGTTLDASAA